MAGNKDTSTAIVSQKRKFDDYYDQKDILKRGAFGEAALIISKQDGTKYVMKKENINSLESRDRRRDEIKSLKKCSHQNIVKYFEDFFEDGDQRIVMEYCPGKICTAN